MSLSLADISVVYGRKPVLAGIDLPHVAAGSVVGLLGANGAGKSTLLRALALNPDILHRAYGILGRVESCSLGFPMVLADSAAERRFP